LEIENSHILIKKKLETGRQTFLSEKRKGVKKQVQLIWGRNMGWDSPILKEKEASPTKKHPSR